MVRRAWRQPASGRRRGQALCGGGLVVTGLPALGSALFYQLVVLL